MADTQLPRKAPRFVLLAGLRPLGRAEALRDALAGVTLAAMNVPQALGYARIAGMPLITGLYTLLLPLVAFAAFGSSRYLVVAADSATAAILAGALVHIAPRGSDQYVALAGIAALLTGGLLLLARLFRLGFLADFLSRTVLVGFLTGVGLQVAIGELGDMLGIQADAHGTVAQLVQVVAGLGHLHLPTLAVSVAVIVCVLGCRYGMPRIPGPLIAVVGVLVASRTFDFAGRGIQVIGAVPGGLPHLALPALTWREFLELLPAAASCFVMIIAQSAATARAYALRHHDALDADTDLVGLGAANVAAACTGTFVVNGSPTQTAMVERAGARSQTAQLATAIVVAGLLLLATGPLQYLPRGALAAIVFTIAIGLIDVPGLQAIRRESPGEFTLALTAAAVVVLIGVQHGILLAMVLSLLRHVRHSYQPSTSIMVPDEGGRWIPVPAVPGVVTEPGLIVYRFAADLFYANVEHFTDELRNLVTAPAEPVRWVVIDAGAITDIDYSAAAALRELLPDLRRLGLTLLFARVRPELETDFARHGIVEALGRERIFPTLHEALAAVHRGLS
ncbi:SulP family inorganic anion transporter [Candidatus Binatia bacterium]|nr:SulP family inorganic anion transporter [Candidatus Binatia bacterium]